MDNTSNTYFQFLLTRAGQVNTGYMVDNIFISNEVPSSTHTCVESYVNNLDGTHSVKCADCGKILSTSEHSYTWTTTEPTCATAGAKNGTCACGATNNESIPALSHDFGFGNAAQVVGNTLTYTCANCSATMWSEVSKIDTFANGGIANTGIYQNYGWAADYSDGYASFLIPQDPSTVTNNGVALLYAYGAGGYTLTSKASMTLSFDLAMPQAGFPDGKDWGVAVIGRLLNGWGLGDVPMALNFKENAVYAHGDKIMDLTADEWHNYALQVDLSYDGSNVTAAYTLYIDFVKKAEFSYSAARAQDVYAAGHSTNSYFVVKIDTTAARASTPGTGVYMDNICYLNVPMHEHVASQTLTYDAIGHWHTCTICGQHVDGAAHSMVLDEEQSTMVDPATHQAGHANIAGDLVYVCADACGASYTVAADSVITFAGGHVCESVGSTFGSSTTGAYAPNLTKSYDRNKLTLSGNMKDATNNFDIQVVPSYYNASLADTMTLGFEITIPEGCTNFGGGIDFPFKFGGAWTGGVILSIDGNGNLLLGGSTNVGKLTPGKTAGIVLTFRIGANASDATKADLVTEIHVNGVYGGTHTKTFAYTGAYSFSSANTYVNVKIDYTKAANGQNNDAAPIGTVVIDNLFVGSRAPMIPEE